MIIGRDILPNVFINNIEIYDNKVKYDIMIFDSITNPVWSNKKSLESLLILKHAVFLDEDTIEGIKSGTLPFSRNQEEVQIKLVSKAMRFETTGNQNLAGQICYIKSCSYKLPDEYENISIFANVYVDQISEQGPIASEAIMKNGDIVSTTNVLYRGNQQYYGPVHYHEGVYMEGKRHRPTPHSVIDVRPALNLKIKDNRTKIYQYNSIKDETPVPVFSNLLPSFDNSTRFNYMFFINIEQLLIENTKFGRFYNQINQADRESLLNEILFSSIRIKRLALKSKSGGVYETINVLSGYESRINGYQSTSGQKLEFISHKIGPSIRAIKFHDNNLSQNSSGEYKYIIELVLRDENVVYIRNFLNRISNAIDRLEDFSNSLMLIRNYDKSIRKTKDSINQNFFVQNSLFEKYSYLFVEMKEFVYDLDAKQRNNLLTKSFVQISPRSCTIESVEAFIKDFKNLYNEILRIYGLTNSRVKQRYTEPTRPKTENFTNRIFITHEFKNLIKPSGTKLHYIFENEEEVTGENVSTAVSRTPFRFGSAGKNFKFSNPFINESIKGKFSNTSPSITVGLANTVIVEPSLEKHTPATEYLGDDTNFNTVEDEEKCERTKENPIIVDEVELMVTSESEDIKAEMSNFTTILETLAGFVKSESGKFIVTQPEWLLYSGAPIQATTIIKQIPTGDIKDSIDYPYPNKYKLLNNTSEYKFMDLALSAARFSNNELTEASNNYQAIDPMFTQGNIVINEQTDIGNNFSMIRTPAIPAPMVTTQQGPLPEYAASPQSTAPAPTPAPTQPSQAPVPTMSTTTTNTGGY